MSVNSEINRLNTAKTNIKSAIVDSGVSVPSTASISDYDDYVRAIPDAVLTSADGRYVRLDATNIGKGDSDILDSTYLVTSHVSGLAADGGANSLYLRSATYLKNYIKGVKVSNATAADSATKATKDGSGNVITTTYATTIALNNLGDSFDTFKGTIKTVATTGSYNDLTNKPTIPTNTN